MPSTQPEHTDYGPQTLLDAWRRRHRIRQREMARVLSVSQQQAQRYCLPRRHPNHNRPGPDISDRLRAWSGGAIHAGNYSDPYDPTEPLPPAPAPEGVRRADAVPADTQ